MGFRAIWSGSRRALHGQGAWRRHAIGGVACSKTCSDNSPTPLPRAHQYICGHPMACVVGAFNALTQVDRVGLEQRLAHWEIALAAHDAVRCVRRLGAFIAVELEDANAVQRPCTQA